MRIKTFSPAGLMAMGVGVVGFFLFGFYALAGIGCNPNMWWLYILAFIGSEAISREFLRGWRRLSKHPDNPRTRIGGGR